MGCVIETFLAVEQDRDYSWKEVLPWIIGGAMGTAAGYFLHF